MRNLRAELPNRQANRRTSRQSDHKQGSQPKERRFNTAPLKRWLPLLMVVMAAGLVLVGYTLSVIWRVSLAERDLFGKSTLIPMAAQKSFEEGPCSVETFWSKSFWYERQGKRILVWKDKINCFQHCYGSALAAYELGEGPATWLFDANEYMDYIRDCNGIKENSILDRRKDLAHNIVGRRIGLSAKAHGLSGESADAYMRSEILLSMDRGKDVYLSYLDPRVRNLGSEASLGCPGLPERNLIDLAITGRHHYNRLQAKSRAGFRNLHTKHAEHYRNLRLRVKSVVGSSIQKGIHKSIHKFKQVQSI
ncbi:hypothetical protein GC174_12175 [bacterium]|nr:hypothetical protein [bacterium]